MKRRLIAFLFLTALCGCTVVSADRVFPKLTWYWSNDAQRQRESDRYHEASVKAYQASLKTNSVTKTP